MNLTIKNFVQTSEKTQQDEYKTLVKSVLENQAEYIVKSSLDYGCYDYMTKFVVNPDTAEAKQYISPPDYIGVDLFQVFNLQQKEVLCNRSSSHKNFTYKLDANFFEILYRKKFLNFFEMRNNEIIQIIAATIQKTQDTARLQNPFGYLVLIKVYDANYKAKTEKTINCKLIVKTFKSAETAPENVDILLKSYDNSLVGGISIVKNNIIISNVKKLNRKLEWIFISFILILSIITILAYNSIVLRPIGIIQSALNNQSDKIARKLMYKRDEFGKISRLIVRFFEQRKLLDEKLSNLSITKNKLKNLNKEITETANELRTANEEILTQQKNTNDNIYYASAVQRAALIPYFEIENVFKEHLIIFKPRDIISGDFYWFQYFKGRYFVATADCTGHGLSGSLMSMLGISFLNQIVNQSDEHTNAADILKKLRTLIVDSLHQQGSKIEVYDGIDIGLCIFNFETMILDYAAAYNPLFLIRKNNVTSSYELTIYKGDSMPAGVYEVQKDFSNNTIVLQPNDLIYIYTDGFVDQFGGPCNKKYLTKKYKDLLLSIAHLPLAEQKEIINCEFEEWKGKQFQVDDVTIVGLKIGSVENPSFLG